MTKNLKIYTASFMALLTMLTASGCSAKIEKEPINETTIIEQVEEPVVEIDPNAPLFDITDETVFNQKVDELYAEIENMTLPATGELLTREQASFILLTWNIENISHEQLTKLEESNYGYIDYLNILNSMAVDKMKNGKEFNFSVYASNPKTISILEKIDLVFSDYIKTGDLTEQDREIIRDSITNYKSTVENNEIDSLAWSFAQNAFFSLCLNYENKTGVHLAEFDLILEQNGIITPEKKQEILNCAIDACKTNTTYTK